MACGFSFQLDPGNSEAQFRSNDGEEYFVKLTYTAPRPRYHGGYNSCDILIKWRSYLNVAVMVQFESTENQNSPSLKKINIVQGTETNFTIGNNGYQYNACFIHVLPLLSMLPHSTEASKSKSAGKIAAVPVNKGAVIEKKFDQLSADMQNLLLKSDLSDVVLSDGSTDFPAHKLVLSARSTVFAKMFQHPLKEKRENRVTITDISADVLKELLSYIYTGIARVKDDKMARNLYVAADKYDINHLKIVCSAYLKDVNVDNVLDTLVLANLYGDKTLKLSSMDFIARNFSLVKSQQSWEKFIKENQVLTIELLSFVVEKK